MRLEEKKLRTINEYRGIIVNTRLDYACLPDGSMALREVVEHPGGVAVLPLEDDGTVWCVRQFRYPFSETLLEIPAGKLETGEEPEQAARRELSEETGLEAGELRYLGRHYCSPGYNSEILHIFLARDLRHGTAHPDAGEFLSVERHPLSALTALALAGDLPDTKTVVAVLKTQLIVDSDRADDSLSHGYLFSKIASSKPKKRSDCT